MIDIHGDWWQIDRALETASYAAHNEGPSGLHPCPKKDYGTFHDDVTNQDIGTATVTSRPNVEIMFSEPPLILTTTSGWHVQKSVAKQRAAIEREENDGNPTALACENWETMLNGHQHCTSWGRDLSKVRP